MRKARPTMRQRAALKGWETRRAKAKAARIRLARQILKYAVPLSTLERVR